MSPERPRPVGINHVALEVDDVERAIAFYGRLFDLRSVERAHGGAFVDLGDQFIALFPPGSGEDRHFGLVVDDKERARQVLAAEGVETFGPRLDFRDPFGNWVQVVQYDQIQFRKDAQVLHAMGLRDLVAVVAAGEDHAARARDPPAGDHGRMCVSSRTNTGTSMGAMLVVVDGNNVMGSRPDGWWKDRAGAARRLVEQLGDWAAREDRDVLVIFDGAEPPDLQAPPRVEVRFARRAGRDAADDDIAAFVADHDGPLLVFTSDRELARRVRERGAEVSGARELLDRL